MSRIKICLELHKNCPKKIKMKGGANMHFLS